MAQKSQLLGSGTEHKEERLRLEQPQLQGLGRDAGTGQGKISEGSEVLSPWNCSCVIIHQPQGDKDSGTALHLENKAHEEWSLMEGDGLGKGDRVSDLRPWAALTGPVLLCRVKSGF